MTNEERYKKYIKEQCKNCKNKNSNVCEIRIVYFDGIITTMCSYYERDKTYG